MSPFISKNRLKYAAMIATQMTERARALVPTTEGFNACVSEFFPGIDNSIPFKGKVSVEEHVERYTEMNEDPSTFTGDAMDAKVEEVATFVRTIIEKARGSVAPMAVRMEAAIAEHLRVTDDIFSVSQAKPVSDAFDFASILNISDTLGEPDKIPAIRVVKTPEEIVALLKASQVLPVDQTEAFVDALGDSVVAYYNVFYDGRFNKANPLILAANTHTASDCLLVGLMASEYFSRHVERLPGQVVSLNLWNDTVTLMTRFCLSRLARTLRTRDYQAKTNVLVSDVKRDADHFQVFLNPDVASTYFKERNGSIEAVLGAVLANGETVNRLTVEQIAERSDLYSKRYEQEAATRRLIERSKQLRRVAGVIEKFVVQEINPDSDTLIKLRNDPALKQINLDNIWAACTYVVATYIVKCPLAHLLLTMMEVAKDGLKRTTDEIRGFATAGVIDFLAYVLANQFRTLESQPSEVVTRIED